MVYEKTTMIGLHIVIRRRWYLDPFHKAAARACSELVRLHLHIDGNSKGASAWPVRLYHAMLVRASLNGVVTTVEFSMLSGLAL